MTLKSNDLSHLHPVAQRTLTNFVRGSITEWLTSCLTGLDLTEQVNLLFTKYKQSNGTFVLTNFNFTNTKLNLNSPKPLVYNSGCDTVGRVVASNTAGPKFESSNIFWTIY